MSGLEIGMLSFLLLGLLIYAGLHISSAMMAIAFFGLWMIKGDPVSAASTMAVAASDSVSDYEYGTIPLFVLMGFLVMLAGVGRDTYEVAHQMMRKVPGGLGHATVVGNAIFSAITGVSVAAVVMFTRLAVPEMCRRGYDRRFAVGVVAGSAMLGMLIPPSVLMILYAILTEVSIGDLFLAGVIPGLLLSFSFCGVIYWMAKRSPHRFGGNLIDPEQASHNALKLIKLATPIVLMVLLVLGGIYAGWFTATESGAVGAAAALALALWRRVLTWRIFRSVLTDTGYVTASLVLIIIAASMYSRFLAASGMPSALEGWVLNAHLGSSAVLAVYIVVVLVLGTALDSASTTLIAVPIFTVLFNALGMDLVWIGIITMITVEIGLITPPLGMAPFVIKMTLDKEYQSITLNDIYAGALPFVGAALAVVALIIAFPKLVTGLL